MLTSRIIYYADCSAATAAWFAGLKNKNKNELRRHIRITQMILDDVNNDIVTESDREVHSRVQRQLDEAVKTAGPEYENAKRKI